MKTVASPRPFVQVSTLPRVSYDGNGFLVGVDDTIKDVNDRTIVNDASGKVLFIKQAGHIQRQLVVNGEVLGRYGEAVDANQPRNEVGTPVFEQVIDFGFGFTPQGGNTPTVQARFHTVGAGDTLQSLAQMYYGDSKLWYRVAEANGLAGNQDLRAGQALKIPGTETSSNADKSFKPYDPSEVVGDTSPYVPLPKKKSNFFKQLLVMVVVLVVAYVTQQYYLMQEGIAAVTAAGEVSASALSTNVLTSVGTAMPGATGAAGAVGSVAGSFAGQVAGLALGTQDKFSWKQFALSAVSASVGYGLNEVNFVGGKLDSFANSALRASIGNTVTQGIGVATGLQKSFDWRGVAASAIGAGVGNAIGAELGLNNRDTVAKMGFGEQFGKRLVTGMVAGTMTAVARGGRVAIQQVAVDAFGNALGSSIASSSNSGPATQGVEPWADGDYVNGADLQSDQAYEARRAQEWTRTSDAIQDRRLYEITAANAQDNFRATERGHRQDLETARQVNGLDLPSDYVLPGPNMTAADWARRAQLIGAGRSAAPSPLVAWAGGAGGGRGFVNPADAILHNPTAFAGRSTITDPRTYQAQARLTPLDAARAAVGVEKELQALMSTRPNSSEGWATYKSAVGALSERYQTTMRSGGLEPDITLVTTMNFQRSIAGYQVDGDISRMAGTALAAGVVFGMQNVSPGVGGPQSAGLARTAGGSSPTSLDWTRISPRTGGDAAAHVIENHGSLSLTKPNQGVFYGSPIVAVEDAWSIAQRSGIGPVAVGNRDIYVIPRANSGYAGGMGGQRQNLDYVTIITESGTSRVVTGYPSGGTPPLPKGYQSLFGSL